MTRRFVKHLLFVFVMTAIFCKLKLPFSFILLYSHFDLFFIWLHKLKLLFLSMVLKMPFKLNSGTFHNNLLTILQEVPTNGADLAHLYHVHNPVIFAGIDLTKMWNKYLRFACHKWAGSWSQYPPPDEHIGCLSLEQDLQIFGKCFSPLHLSVKAKQVLMSLVTRKTCLRGLRPNRPAQPQKLGRA